MENYKDDVVPIFCNNNTSHDIQTLFFISVESRSTDSCGQSGTVTEKRKRKL